MIRDIDAYVFIFVVESLTLIEMNNLMIYISNII